MSTSWVLLPGLAEAPEEFGEVLALLSGRELRVIDPWLTPVTAPVSQLRSGMTLPVGLLGHSIGGLAALRWTLAHPDEVDRLVLIDSSLTSETGWRWLYPGTRGDRVVRSVLRGLARIGVPALLGTAARRVFIRVGSMRNNDRLSKATARSRYAAAGSWLLFWDELSGSWALAAEVARLLESPPAVMPPTVVLVATGGSSRFTANSWLAGQRALAAKLNATVEVLPDSAHLVHLDRPDAIAKAVTSLA
ncbi:alpha/beta hydrolase [Streptomyces sp. SID13031]|uniref:alpha/beta fold hydrolase n=1 Tax=Streptomyces sp. SID13031 TaxID=2706046 RepID=UPI0013CC0994|nr:alpha/beta hydrolase [Streptomyces sp. SID13031]NEA34391.1 alpha/beta hydrolase [Streptomyces sp. SID13031]